MKPIKIITLLAIVSFISTQSFSQSKWKLDIAYNNFFELAKRTNSFIYNNITYKNTNRDFNGFSICPKYKFTSRFNVLTGIDFLFNYNKTNEYNGSVKNYQYKIGLPIQFSFDFIQFKQLSFYTKAGFLFKYRFAHLKYISGGTYNTEKSLDYIEYYLGYGLGGSFNLNDKYRIFIESTHNHDIGAMGSNSYSFFDSKLGISLSF